MTTSRVLAMASSCAKPPLSSVGGHAAAPASTVGYIGGRGSGGGALAGPPPVQRAQFLAEIRSDRLHAVDAGIALGVRVVVGVRVDIVRMDLAVAVGDELDAGDADVV